MEITVGIDKPSAASGPRSQAASTRMVWARTALRRAWGAWVESTPYLAGVFGAGFFPIVRKALR